MFKPVHGFNELYRSSFFIGVFNFALIVSSTCAAPAGSQGAILDSSMVGDGDMAILQASKPLVTRLGAWQTWNDQIHLKAGQEKLPLRLTFVNGADGRAKFTDLKVQLGRKPFATLKDFNGSDTFSFNLSDKLTAGNTALSVQGFGPSGARLNWRLCIQRPAIVGVSPDPINADGRITVSGKNFTEQTSQIKVFVASRAAEIISAKNTEIQLKLPAHVQSGGQELVVVVHSVKSVPFKVRVRANPQVTWINMVATAPGQPVIISGHGFSTNISENTVKFGSVKAHIVSATASSIECLVPDLDFPQWHVPITVTTNGMQSKEKASINIDQRVIPNEGIPMH